MTSITDNRAARRRQAQRELRTFAERLARMDPWLTDEYADRCRYSGAVRDKFDARRRGDTKETGHRDACLWREVRGWLDRRRVDSEA